MARRSPPSTHPPIFLGIYLINLIIYCFLDLFIVDENEISAINFGYILTIYFFLEIYVILNG